MSLLNLIWDLSQNKRISDLQSEVHHLKAATKSRSDDPTKNELDELRLANGELRLYVATLFRILEQKGIIARADIEKLVEQIDAEDGKRDNTYSGEALP